MARPRGGETHDRYETWPSNGLAEADGSRPRFVKRRITPLHTHDTHSSRRNPIVHPPTRPLTTSLSGLSGSSLHLTDPVSPGPRPFSHTPHLRMCAALPRARRLASSINPRAVHPHTHTPSCVSLTHATLNNILCVYGMTQSVGIGIRHDYSAEAATAIERFSMFCASTYDRKERPLVFSITCW